jgi:hypothetical protein
MPYLSQSKIVKRASGRQVPSTRKKMPETRNESEIGK